MNRHLGTVEVRDQADGVAFVAASWPEVDTRRVGITGGSYGGYITLRCLTEAPDVFHAGVAIAPVTDWDGYDTCYTERYMGTPASNPEGYRTSSVLTRAATLHGALLIIHGMLDENVHFRHTARLATALIGASKPIRALAIARRAALVALRARPSLHRGAARRVLRGGARAVCALQFRLAFESIKGPIPIGGASRTTPWRSAATWAATCS